MNNKILLNDLLKFEKKDFEDIRIRFCMKNYEPKYAIDDYKIDHSKVNEDWLLTTIKEIVEEIDVRDKKVL